MTRFAALVPMPGLSLVEARHHSQRVPGDSVYELMVGVQ